MVSPYRGEAPKAPTCPRCQKGLPPLDVAACPRGCGTWVSQFASTEVLTEADRRPDPVTRWWRLRVPCPLCAEQMTLRGDDPALLQGCDLHGFFIDADVVAHTGLARGVDLAALERKRSDTVRIEAEQAALLTAHHEELQRKREIETREAELGIVKQRPPRIERPLDNDADEADERAELQPDANEPDPSEPEPSEPEPSEPEPSEPEEDADTRRRRILRDMRASDGLMNYVVTLVERIEELEHRVVELESLIGSDE